MSQKSCDAIHALLRRHYEYVEVTIVNNLSDLEQLVRAKPDLVFLGMKFLPANNNFGHKLGRWGPAKIWISEYLDEHDISYTGSNRQAIELEFNKPRAKQHALDAGLDTSHFFVARQDDYYRSSYDLPLTFPLFVKPVDKGGGRGVDAASVVSNFSDFKAKVESIAVRFQSDCLVEEYLPGREFSVAILENEHSEEVAVMPIELIAAPDTQGNRILGQKVKSSNSEHVSTVADENVRHEVARLATDIFYALGARDYGRIDIRLDKDGIPQFLEANLIPSLISGYGSFPKACVLNMNMDYETMILKIVGLGLARNVEILPETAMLGTADSIILGLKKPLLEPV